MLASIIPTRVHGVIDYIVGVLLIAAPWLFHFEDDRSAMLVPVALGVGTILYSLITNYELGAFRVLPMPTHLWIDLVAGVLLAASPWLFGFSQRIIWPHLLVGIMEIVVVLISSPILSMVGRGGLDSGAASDSGGNMGRPRMV